jgi:hypothetical protein
MLESAGVRAPEVGDLPSVSASPFTDIVASISPSTDISASTSSSTYIVVTDDEAEQVTEKHRSKLCFCVAEQEIFDPFCCSKNGLNLLLFQ